MSTEVVLPKRKVPVIKLALAGLLVLAGAVVLLRGFDWRTQVCTG